MINKKLLVFSVLLITLVSIISVQAAEFSVSKQAVNDVVAIELTIPAKYNVAITNLKSYSDKFEFVTLVNALMLPKGQIEVPSGQTVTVPVTFLPNNRVRYNFNFEYFVRDNSGNAVKDALYVKILPIAEIVSVTIPADVGRDDATLPIRIVNKENIDLGNVVVIADSDAFYASTNVAVPANTAVTANLPLAGTKIKTTEAGAYNIRVTLYLNNEYNYTNSGQIQLKEFSNLVSEQKIQRNFFGYTKTLSVKNNGNIKQLATIELPFANFIEQAFTHFSLEPTSRMTTKSGVQWQRQIVPGESFTVYATTDYTLLIIIIALIAIVVIAYISIKKRRVIVSKKAIRIKTKGGEFASKIIVLLKNVSGHEITNLNLVDRLPLTTQLYEKFGSVKPDKTDKHRIEWNFPAILPGEEIVVSYVLYARINMVGTIYLPTALLSFTDSKGKRKTVNSNKLLINAGD